MDGGSATAGDSSAAGAPAGPGVPFRRPPRGTWSLGRRILDVERPRVMGILNLTPDSFSDGGELSGVEEALERAGAMTAAGADLLDVGGESTRPGAREVPADEELRRILPFLRAAAARFDVPISVDTRKAEVARAAVEAGASVVNDVSGLAHDPDMAPFVAESGVGVVLMHMRGQPANMRSLAEYEDVTGEVRDELARRVDAARRAGVEDERIVVDPGLGFAKDAAHSYRLIGELHRLAGLGFPLLVGPSRKSFLGAVLGTPAGDRLEGTLAACVAAYLAGARIFRVHDVKPVVRALAVSRAVVAGGDPASGGSGSENVVERTERGR